MAKRLLPLLKLLLLPTVLAFVCWALWRDLSRVRDWGELRPGLPWLLAAALLIGGVGVVQLLSYRALLAALGSRLGWRPMAAVAWLPPLGKYVPGKIWALGGAVLMLRRFGVGAAVAVTAVLMLDAFAVLAGLIVGAPLLLQIPGGAVLTPVLVATGLAALHPRVFCFVLDRLLALLGRPALAVRPTPRQLALPLVYGFVQWALAGGALWCLVNAFAPLAPHHLPVVCCIAAAAMTIGYLAVFAPGGLGVTEGLALIALQQLLPETSPGVPAVVVIVWRVVRTVVELLLAAVGTMAMRAGRSTASRVTK